MMPAKIRCWRRHIQKEKQGNAFSSANSSSLVSKSPARPRQEIKTAESSFVVTHGVQNINIVIPNAFSNRDLALSRGSSRDSRLGEGDPESNDKKARTQQRVSFLTRWF